MASGKKAAPVKEAAAPILNATIQQAVLDGIQRPTTSPTKKDVSAAEQKPPTFNPSEMEDAQLEVAEHAKVHSIILSSLLFGHGVRLSHFGTACCLVLTVKPSPTLPSTKGNPSFTLTPTMVV